MPPACKLVHVDDVVPENMQKGDGWAISEFRLPISGRDGSATTLFHSVFRPGSTHAKHLHRNCDEIAVYLRGHGLVGQGGERTTVRPGHCRLMPRGSEHFFHNETAAEDGLVIGFYVGAGSVAETGYAFCGQVGEADRTVPRRAGLSEGVLVHIDDVDPLPLDPAKGFQVTDFRLPIGRHNGSGSALFWARFAPGDVHHRHRLEGCESVCYVVAGEGVIGAAGQAQPVRAGHVQFFPRGAERFIANTGRDTPLEVIGVWTGAGSVEEAGYVHLGAVTAAELANAVQAPATGSGRTA